MKPPPGRVAMRQYLTVYEVAERCRVSHSTAYRWLKEGTLKYKRAGPRRILVGSDELERFIDEPRTK
jgi:excisionase family DNA binding protein